MFLFIENNTDMRLSMNFLSQFVGVDIDNKYDLTKNIDNISGATLSVNSMDRMARAALMLDDIVNENQC